MTKRQKNTRASQDGGNDSASRDKYRDNDDMRAPLSGKERAGTDPDTKTEARGDTREEVGNVARGTDAEPTGPEGNDRTRGRPQPDVFDADLETDNRRKA
jgi:hypothetical protein